ncbi:MAG: GDSL-type esterase/lipase family protein [Nocardioidaceae bacterium]
MRRLFSTTALLLVLPSAVTLAAVTGTPAASAASGVIVPGCNDVELPINDDESSDALDLPFPVKIGSRTFTTAWVNNNGNITFDDSMSEYTPFGLAGTERQIIAPFFADVDTRAAGSAPVTYSWGTTMFNGRKALCVNWLNVGYYREHDDKLNSFQLVLTDRSDTGAGNVDIYFNYDSIEWETGDASDGSGGFGGSSAAVGFSNGADTYFEVPGSLSSGSFIDGGSRPLATTSNVGTPGRWYWPMRGGSSPTTYVALGDSFQSGEGVGSYEAGTGNRGNKCHRSSKAYPHLLVNRGLVTSDLIFGACSGAVMDDFWSAQHSPTQGPQLDLLNDSTRLVTLGIAGNDLQFSKVMEICVKQGIDSSNPLHWNEYRCETSAGRAVAVLLRSLQNGSLRTKLDDLYSAVRERAPRAKVVVFTYPMFFNEPTTTWGVLGHLAGKCNFISGSDQFWINDQIAAADRVIGSAARAHGFRVVDLSGSFAFTDHGVCSSAPAMNGIRLSQQVESFHPNALGHSLIADDATPVVRSRTSTGTVAKQLADPGSALHGQPTPSVDLLATQAVTQDGIWAETFTVAGGPLSASAQWLDGNMELTLVSPSGVTYSVPEPHGADVEAQDAHVRFVINDPESGTWQATVRGVEVLTDGEDVTLSLYAEPDDLPVPVPTANATVDGQQVVLDATGSVDPLGQPLTFVWDFGDGTSGEGQQVAHTYAPGTFVPSVVASTPDGRSGAAVLRVIVDQPRDPGQTLGIAEVDDQGVTQAAKPSRVRSLVVKGKPQAAKRTISWARPTDNGGLSVTTYRIVVKAPGRTKPVLVRKVSATHRSLSLRRALLGKGRRIVTVQAVNPVGRSAASTARFVVAF